MRKIKELLLKAAIWQDTRGQDLIEYALLAGFLALAAAAVIPQVGASVGSLFNAIQEQLTTAGSSAGSQGS